VNKEVVGIYFLSKEIASNIKRTCFLPAKAERQGSKGFQKTWRSSQRSSLPYYKRRRKVIFVAITIQ
jgi:hypothetical protein